MQQFSVKYTIGFAAAICLVCSILVSTAAVGLKERQERNALLYKQRNVLAGCGLLEAGETPSNEKVMRLFEEHIEPRVVELSTGEYAENEQELLQTLEETPPAEDPEMSTPAPPNKADVARIPKYAMVYHEVNEEGGVEKIVIPVEGKGLWSTLYGFLVLDDDVKTISGITFYQHGETPGLGGEIDNPKWKAKWEGKVAYNEDFEPVIEVVKGEAAASDEVDGISGATLTSRGVTNLVRFWLGEHGFKEYLKNFRTAGSEG